ncbi:MAG: hypothetical protein MUP98_20550 [Candidatus Aminicenantes bacterium]|nr:hypothetical protein [Candidatus Aminicenantes bacterium]
MFNSAFALLFLLLFMQFPVLCSESDIASTILALVEKSKEISDFKIGVRFLGGAAHFLGNDINDFLNSKNDYNFEMAKGNNRLIIDGEYKPINRSSYMLGEFFLNLSPRIGLGLGVGYQKGHSESKVFMQDPVYFSEDVEITASLSSIPIALSLYYTQPLNDWLNIVLSSGFSYTFGRVNWESSSKTVTTVYAFTVDSKNRWNGKSNALGFHGNMNLEIKLSPNLALVFGGGGSYAKLKNLKGVLAIDVDSTGYKEKSTQQNATLWYSEFENFGYTYPRLDIRNMEPSGNSWKSVREAQVPLTSFGIQAGIKIIFGRLYRRME